MKLAPGLHHVFLSLVSCLAAIPLSAVVGTPQPCVSSPTPPPLFLALSVPPIFFSLLMASELQVYFFGGALGAES